MTRASRCCTGSGALSDDSFGTLHTWAEELGYSKSVHLLQQTLEEERATDASLTKLAKAVINLDAEKDEAAA